MVFAEYSDIIKRQTADIAASENLSFHEAYFQLMRERFSELSIADDLNKISMPDDVKIGSKLAHIDGYSFDDTDHSMSLYICDYESGEEESQRLASAMLDRLYWRMFYFLEAACADSISPSFERSGDAFKAARVIRDRMGRPLSDPDRILKVHFVVFTNRQLDTKLLGKNFFDDSRKVKSRKAPKTRKRIKQDDFSGRPVDLDLWPLDRLFEIENADSNELLEIDFVTEFGSDGIPCIQGSLGNNLDYEAYIGIISGKLLADLYIEYGSRILEGNVRAFLGTKSAKGVNNGIKKTINNEPYNFFTYNNGIAITASSVVTRIDKGQLFITGVTDLQIINGGQTTATLAEAVLKKTNPSLEGIFVPVKITVIENREKENDDGILLYDQMVHDIARFANSQNKVTAADLFSNDPFHIWMEKASKKYLAPPVNYNIPTGWYYERSRKKYEQEQFKLKSDELKRFLAKFPKKQIITKEQLAMYLTAVSCKPHLCSRGKNWVMREYGAEIGAVYKKDKAAFNEYYYKKCVGAAIIYRSIDAYLESHKKEADFWYSAGGYKGNIVPYTVSKIIWSIPAGFTLNWSSIWQKQKLSDAFMQEIAVVTKMSNDFFCNFKGVLVSEHCKKEAVWQSFRDEVPYVPASCFIDELIPVSIDKELSRSALQEQKQTDELSLVMEVFQKGVSYWQSLTERAKTGNIGTEQDISAVRSIISWISRGDIPISSSGKIPWKAMNQIQSALRLESQLSDEGVVSFFDADDDEIYELTLTDYKMH